jgi:hypothetical protein
VVVRASSSWSIDIGDNGWISGMNVQLRISTCENSLKQGSHGNLFLAK